MIAPAATLRDHVAAAVATARRLSAAAIAGGAISDAAYFRYDSAALDARRALLAHLAGVHGIDQLLAEALGEVL